MERAFWIICITHMLVEVNLLMQVALIPVIITEFKLGLVEASLVATVPSFVQLIMNIPSGYFAERFSPRNLLFASMLVEGLSGLLASQTNSFWGLIIAISLLKVSSPLYHVLGLSQISRIVRPESINKAMGFHNALGSFGSAIGVVSLSVFLATVGWRWTYFFWAFPILLWGVVLIRSEDLRAEHSEKKELKSRPGFRELSFVVSSGFLVFLIAIAVREIGATGSSTFMTTYFVKERSLAESTASLIYGLGPFVGIVGSLFGGYFGEKAGVRRAFSWMLVGCTASLLTMFYASQLYSLVVVYVLYAFFGNAMWSPMNALVANMVPAKNVGIGFSIYFFTDGITTSIAPTLVAGVIELSAVSIIFPFSALFMFLTLIVFHFVPQSKNDPARLG